MEPYIIYPNGATAPCPPADPVNGFTLEECYKLLDTDIVERLWISKTQMLIIDEEGKFKANAQVNGAATRLASKVLGGVDHIVGAAIVCEAEHFQ